MAFGTSGIRGDGTNFPPSFRISLQFANCNNVNKNKLIFMASILQLKIILAPFNDTIQCLF